MEEMLMPINYILLSVLAGIIGLVLSGFTIWHLYLASTGQTTIESLEKTRYLTPIRKSLQKGMSGQRNYVNGVTTPTYGQQLAEIHANAIPGVTREEEGDVSSPAMSSLRSNYNDMERARERDRYEEYLDEQDSEKLPNAFNLGLKGNLSHVFGRRKLFWFFPICNTTGDGWRWEASKSWIAAREDIARERQRTREQYPPANESVYNNGYGNGSPSRYGQPRARQSPPRYQSHGSNTSRSRSPRPMKRHYEMDNLQWDRSETANWNDVPDDMFSGRRA
ncbi:MAG: palmitoyltransferase for Vac8p [Bogoriella megaspora]|nr:MAG: palmitoyltransferase for Vac8p [Bogoriella megaspora]